MKKEFIIVIIIVIAIIILDTITHNYTKINFAKINEQLEQIKEKVDYIVNVGKLNDLKESTLVQVQNDNLKILREGKIKKEELEQL